MDKDYLRHLRFLEFIMKSKKSYWVAEKKKELEELYIMYNKGLIKTKENK